MDIITLIDIGSISVILLGILVLILSGYIDKYTDLMPNRSLQLGFFVVFIITFFSINAIYSVEIMRVVVLVLFMSFIIPFSTTFVISWVYVRRPSMTRVQYVSYISWLLTLIFTMILRLLLGWGIGDSIITAVIFAAFISIANGVLGAIVAIFILSQLEEYRPSNRQLQE